MNEKKFVFDLDQSVLITEKRIECIREILKSTPEASTIKTALDAGCGIGYFSKALLEMGYEVTAFDVRDENTLEAGRRNPDAVFHTYNAEDPAVCELGHFDFVLCVGLLYHLENPFVAVRNLASLTDKILILGTMIEPADKPTAMLLSESGGVDQGVNYVAFIPSVPCLIKMLYHAGFTDVYMTKILPDHSDFHESATHFPRRTILVASKIPLSSPALVRVPDHYNNRWDIWRKPIKQDTTMTTGQPSQSNQPNPAAQASNPLEERQMVKLAWGDHWILSNDAMGMHFRSNKPFEFGEQFFTFHYLKPGMTVLDVGAHHGLYTLLASKKIGPNGKIYSFEPSPREYQRLNEHIQLNHCPNVQTIQMAVSEEEGECDFYVCMGVESGCNSLRPPVVQEEVQKISVPVTTLETFLSKNPLPSIDFMKLDVEGAELGTLKGSGDLFKKYRPVILCEVVDMRSAPWGYKCQEVLDYLENLNYRWFSITPRGELYPCQRKENYHENLFAVPEEKIHQIERFMLKGQPPQAVNPPAPAPAQASNQPAPINLVGDRNIEWSWIVSQMPQGPGQALDFGCGGSDMGLVAAQRGFETLAIDMRNITWPYVHPSLRFQQIDLLTMPDTPDFYDLIVNCSTIEHVGLEGRYNVSESREEGDYVAMDRLRGWMKPSGVMLLTIPVGLDALFKPLCRIYGTQRLPKLLEGFTIEKEVYWVKDPQNRYVQKDRETALQFKCSVESMNPLQNVYALGCFVLRKPEK